MQSVKNHVFKIFENMLNITIKVIAYGCSPENGRIPLIVQWYKMVHFMMRNKYLCFFEFAAIRKHFNGDI